MSPLTPSNETESFTRLTNTPNTLTTESLTEPSADSQSSPINPQIDTQINEQIHEELNEQIRETINSQQSVLQTVKQSLNQPFIQPENNPLNQVLAQDRNQVLSPEKSSNKSEIQNNTPEVKSTIDNNTKNDLETADKTTDIVVDTEEMNLDRSVGFLPVLRNRNFLALWSGQVFSQLADKVYLVMAIAVVVSQFDTENQSINGWVSAITIASTIPAILFGFFAGVYVDRHRKKQVLVITNLFRGLLVLALPTCLTLTKNLAWHSPWGLIPIGFLALLGITFSVSTLTQFFAPAEQAVMPLIIERKYLLSANSLYATTMMASVIIGFAVGEPLLSFANLLFHSAIWGKEVIVGGCYILASLLLLFIFPHESKKQLRREETHFVQDLKDGLKVLRQYPSVRSAMIQLIVLFCIFAALAILAVRLAEVMPALDTDQFGFLLAAGGVGMAIGAITVGHIGERFTYGLLAFYGSVGMGVALAITGFFTERLSACLISIGAIGFFAALVVIPMQTAIQSETPEAMRGKVFGLQNNAVNIALSLPLAIAGIAEAYFGLRVVFLALALVAILSGISSRWFFRSVP